MAANHDKHNIRVCSIMKRTRSIIYSEKLRMLAVQLCDDFSITDKYCTGKDRHPSHRPSRTRKHHSMPSSGENSSSVSQHWCAYDVCPQWLLVEASSMMTAWFNGTTSSYCFSTYKPCKPRLEQQLNDESVPHSAFSRYSGVLYPNPGSPGMSQFRLIELRF